MQEAPIAPLLPAAPPGPITGEPLQTQPGSVNTGQYDWTSADGAVTFLASKTLLEELRAAAYRAKFGSRRAGVEIGGVLYGRRAPSGVELQGWAPIGCGWAYGPSFR